jgi:hypothetical protein
MKTMKNIKKIVLSIILVLAVSIAFADVGPPDPGSNPGSEPPLGGGAPLGEGLFILIGLGAAYGARKIYNMKKEELEE